MFRLLSLEIQVLEPILSLIFFIGICTLSIFLLWSIWVSAHTGIANVKRLHQIKCVDCRYFTNDFRLKCTVHPTDALTEEAINCSDFCDKNQPVRKLTSSLY